MAETEILNVAEDAVEIATRTMILRLVVLASISWTGGCAATYYLTKRTMKAKYEKIIAAEIAEAKDFYARFYKRDEFETPESANAAFNPDEKVAITALRSYQSGVQDGVVIKETTVEIEEKNIFTERDTDDDWDQEQENAYRDSIDSGEPFIINHDEFMTNEFDYQQPTLTYFADDDVLVDEKEKPIDAIDSIVGEGNLTRFGHGSNDNRIVYVRNNKLSMDFEIVKNEGSYARDVLGFQHSDQRPGIRKFRGVDE